MVPGEAVSFASLSGPPLFGAIQQSIPHVREPGHEGQEDAVNGLDRSVPGSGHAVLPDDCDQGGIQAEVLDLGEGQIEPPPGSLAVGWQRS